MFLRSMKHCLLSIRFCWVDLCCAACDHCKQTGGFKMDYQLREIEESEYFLLEDFLYEAIFVPEGVESPPKSILACPELQVHIENFGTRNSDKGIIADVDGEIIGAVWTRIMNDYGHIDDQTPSFAISLYKEFRGLGIGTAMMKAMLSLLQESGWDRASLSVQKENYAVKMYQSLGFRIVDEDSEEYIMAIDLRKDVACKATTSAFQKDMM